MRLAQLGVENEYKTVVILGAGASRGANFVDGIGVQPPLDADFFEQAQRVPEGRLTTAELRIFQFLRTEFGLTNTPTLEAFFTQIQAVDEFHRAFNIRGRPSGKFGKQLAALRRLIPTVFQEAFLDRTCKWHSRLAASLRAGDAVLSFNYDCLIDEALATEAPRRWRASNGYGFYVREGVERWEAAPGRGAQFKKPILLLKPHGSLNWVIEGSGIRLAGPYTKEAAGSIVPPTWDKTEVARPPWSDVWRQARTVLGQARQVAVIGYSVPLTDQLSQALLRADVTNLRTLVIVNPDRGARDRVKDVFSSALGDQTKLIELPHFADFASHLPRAPSEPRHTEIQQRFLDVANTLEGVENELFELRDRVGHVESRANELEEETARIDGIESDAMDAGLERSDMLADLQQLEGQITDAQARLDSLRAFVP